MILPQAPLFFSCLDERKQNTFADLDGCMEIEADKNLKHFPTSTNKQFETLAYKQGIKSRAFEVLIQ
jgi:hypothetical protein